MTAHSTIRGVIRSCLSIYILLAITPMMPLTVSAQTPPDSSVVWNDRQTHITRATRLTSLERSGSENRLELKPYVLAGRHGSRSWLHERYSELKNQKEEKVGLDARLMLGSEFTLDATLNTDFALVENDLEQIQIDRFPLFFPEKREYFLENHDLFTLGLAEDNAPPPFQLFYSRRIGLATSAVGDFYEVPISGSVRLTEKDGPWTIGVLTFRTEKVNHRENESYLDGAPPPGYDTRYNRIPTSTYGVIRISRDIPKGSRIGVMLLGINPGPGGVPYFGDVVIPEHYRAGGVDASISLFRNTQLSGFLAGSRRSDGKTVPAASLNYFWSSDRWGINFINLYVDEDWEDDMGFVLRTGTLRNTVDLSWSLHKNFMGLGQVVFFADTDYFTRPGGRLESRSFSPGVKLLLRNGGQVVLGGDARYENIDQKFWLDGKPREVGISPDIYRWIDGFISVNTGVAAPVGVNATLAGGPYYDADRYTLFGTLWCQPLSSLRFEGQFFMNSIQRRPPWGKRLLEGEVLAGRITWTPTAYSLVRLFVQKNTVTDLKIVNLLVALRYKPGSWLYLVWKDVIEREFYMWDWHSTNRVLLLKLTYQWNL